MTRQDKNKKRQPHIHRTDSIIPLTVERQHDGTLMLAGGGSTSIDDPIAATRVGGGIINKARTAPRSAARSKPEVHLRSKLTKYQQCSPVVHTRNKFKKESRRRTTTQVITRYFGRRPQTKTIQAVLLLLTP